VVAGLELGERLLDRADLRSHRSGNPVDRAELVEDRSLDAADRIGLELEASAGLELVDGVDQPEHPVADQIGLLHVLRETDRHTTGDVLHQRRVVNDERVTDLGIRVLLVRRPQLLQLRGVDVAVVQPSRHHHALG